MICTGSSLFAQGSLIDSPRGSCMTLPIGSKLRSCTSINIKGVDFSTTLYVCMLTLFFTKEGVTFQELFHVPFRFVIVHVGHTHR